jgi:hypothetical protein
MPVMHKEYLMSLMCDDTVTEEYIPEFSKQIENVLREYDTDAKMLYITHRGNIKSAINAQNYNLVYVFIQLTYNNNIGVAIANIKRKFHRANHVDRCLLETIKTKKTDESKFTVPNIQALRKEIEPAIYTAQ